MAEAEEAGADSMPAAVPNNESSALRIGRRDSDGVSMLMLVLLCVLSGLSMLAVTLACCGHKRKHKMSDKKVSNKNFYSNQETSSSAHYCCLPSANQLTSLLLVVLTGLCCKHKPCTKQ